MTASWKYLVGDAREVLRTLPEGSVQVVVTSPPYHGLRDYGIPPSIWGGDPECEHIWGEEQKIDRKVSNNAGLAETTSHLNRDPDRRSDSGGAYCQCGAWRGCLGLEPTIHMFVDHIVEIFREVRRVLRDDGIVLLNLGDSYASGAGRCFNPGGGETSLGKRRKAAGAHPLHRGNVSDLRRSAIKPKDMIGMPWTVAFALRDDGWWLKKEIIWNKPNPMPESVKKRPTSSHEQIFMLTKSGNPLYWTHRDGAGSRVKPKADYRYQDLLLDFESIERPEEFNIKDKVVCPVCHGEGELSGWFGVIECENCEGKGKVRRWKRINLWSGHDYFYDAEAVREPLQESTRARMESKCITPEENPHPDSKWPDGDQRQHAFLYKTDIQRGRNLRDVWTIPTQPYSKAHFATFPEKIPETCIKAGTSERGACPSCGAPWERIIERAGSKSYAVGKSAAKREAGLTTAFSGYEDGSSAPIFTTKGFQPTCECVEDWKRRCGADKNGEYHGKATKDYASARAEDPSAVKARILAGMGKRTVGYQPTCDCDPREPVPCVVLDPFAGSGTTVKVARRLGRSAIAIDINPDYKELAEERAMLKIPDIMSYDGKSPSLLEFTENEEEVDRFKKEG